MTASGVKTLFDSTFDQLNQTKKKAWLQVICVAILRYLSLTVAVVGVWTLVRPDEPIEQLVIGLTSLIIFAVSGGRIKKEVIDRKKFLLFLEMNYSSTKYSASSLEHETERFEAEAEWQQHLEREVLRLKNFEKSRMRIRISTLVIPMALASVLLMNTKPAIGVALKSVATAVFKSQQGISLTVLQGASKKEDLKTKKLTTSSPANIALLAKNLIRIDVIAGNPKNPPIVVLKKTAKAGDKTDPANKEKIFQSFQLSPKRKKTSDISGQDYSLTFSIQDSVSLYITSISNKKPMANFVVKKLPIPIVSLKTMIPIRDPWPDDKPIPLLIKASGKNSLAKINLIIRAGKRESRELINNVMIEKKFEITSNYKLILEPYLESDLAEVEIIAEVIDRAVPTPLIGYSKPLRINTASAYGRYQRTLQTLREVKTKVDDSIANKKESLDEEVYEIIKRAVTQSLDSPFFDALDRIQIAKFNQDITRNKLNPSLEKVYNISSKLNNFLFEHEILDDRERDRDFFVAARGLSRLLEQEKSKRPIDVTTVTERITRFLNTREARWKIRVGRLGPTSAPKSWTEISSKRPFHKTMSEISAFDKKDDPRSSGKSLEKLSLAVRKFRNWINELERTEDSQRKEKEQKRQKGLASARNEIRELQKKQGKISTKLDRASSKDQQMLSENWPAVKMKQKSNVVATNRLENKLRSLSPTAASRIKASIKAMKGTVESGDQQGFVIAESQSDLAGRLLRQAESATRQSQKRQKSRGRRRRVSGDNYYGQSVVGGDVDIKREYQVDRRYREDILEEVQGSGVEGENKALLENYLRKVIR